MSSDLTSNSDFKYECLIKSLIFPSLSILDGNIGIIIASNFFLLTIVRI